MPSTSGHKDGRINLSEAISTHQHQATARLMHDDGASLLAVLPRHSSNSPHGSSRFAGAHARAQVPRALAQAEAPLTLFQFKYGFSPQALNNIGTAHLRLAYNFLQLYDFAN